MPPYEPVLLANIRKPDSHTLAVYEAGGGYRALRRVLKDMSPKQVVDMVRASNLRGRGGAGFPTGLKWSFLPRESSGADLLLRQRRRKRTGHVRQTAYRWNSIRIRCLKESSSVATPRGRPPRTSISATSIPFRGSGWSRPSTKPARPATWERTSSAARSRWRCMFIAARRPTCAAKRPG